jgi:hypothetical protein
MNRRDQKVRGCSCVTSAVCQLGVLIKKERRLKASKDEQKKQVYREANAALARLVKELPLAGDPWAAGL